MVKLNDDDSKPLVGQFMRVIGFGATSEGGNDASILQQTDIKMISTATCNRADAYDGGVDNEAEFCAAHREDGKNKDSCQGDSGGPVFTTAGNGDAVQVGVVSWGEGCARSKYPGVYAKVAAEESLRFIKTEACAMTKVCSDLCPNHPTCNGDDNGGDDNGGDNGGDDNGGGDNGDGGNTGTSCRNNEIEVELEIRTDDWGDETAWELLDGSGNVLAEAGFDSMQGGKTYKPDPMCLPKNGCYNFKIKDSYEDGLENDGGFTIKVDGRVVKDQRGFDFGASHMVSSINGQCQCSQVHVEVNTDRRRAQTKVFMYDWDSGEYFLDYDGFGKRWTTYDLFACVPRNRCTALDLYDRGGLNSEGITVTVDGKEEYSGRLNDWEWFADIGNC